MKLKRKNQKGFTLVEMIVVIAIIGVLAAMMVPALLGFVDKSNESNKNAVAAGLGRGVETLLIDPKFDGKITGGTIKVLNIADNKTVPDFLGGPVPAAPTVDDLFKVELAKIAGTGYEKGSDIYILIDTTTKKLTRVVYATGDKTDGTPGTALTIDDANAKNAISGKNVGVYFK